MADVLYQFVTQRTGIVVARGGIRKALNHYVDARISELGLSSVQSYVERLKSQETEEFERLIEIITVPHTWFFRDPQQLEAIGHTLQAMAERRRPLRVWVPACATGEDAYSLSLLTERLGIQASVLASDISRRSITLAQEGRYTAWSLRDLPGHYREYFREESGAWYVEPSIRQRVQFRVHNLMSPTPKVEGGWDLVLCRNVLIYFSALTGTACAERIGASLTSAGKVFFGAGELIHNPPPRLRPVKVGQRIAFVAGNEVAISRREPASAASASSMGMQQSKLGAQPLRPVRSEGTRSPSTNAPRPEAVRPDVVSPEVSSASTAPKPTEFQCLPLKPEELQIGQELLDAQDFERAAFRYLALAAQQPTNPVLRMRAGIALYCCRDFGRAYDELRASLLLNDDLWPAALYAALCLDNLGIPQQADTEYRHTVRLLETKNPDVDIPESIRRMTPDLLALAKRRAARATVAR